MDGTGRLWSAKGRLVVTGGQSWRGREAARGLQRLDFDKAVLASGRDSECAARIVDALPDTHALDQLKVSRSECEITAGPLHGWQGVINSVPAD